MNAAGIVNAGAPMTFSGTVNRNEVLGSSLRPCRVDARRGSVMAGQYQQVHVAKSAAVLMPELSCDTPGPHVVRRCGGRS